MEPELWIFPLLIFLLFALVTSPLIIAAIGSAVHGC